MIETPRDLGYRMPGEFEPHTRTWMSWPCNPATYSDRWMAEARAAHARVAQAIAAFEPVSVLVPPELIGGARDLLGSDNIELVECPLDDSWLRDNGPGFLVGPGGLAAVDWGFNGWGHFIEDYGADARAGRAVIAAAGARRFPGPMILEGGSIHVDGEGTLITNRECLLNDNRNPHLEVADIERFLAEYLAVDTVIWLDEGLENDDTDGHIDNVCAFAAPGVVLIGSAGAPADENTRRMAHNRDLLKAATDARGRRLQVIEVPQPAIRTEYPEGAAASGRMSLSYINFYICNGGVIVPRFGDPNDDPAAEVIGAAFPGRQVVQVDSRVVAHGGGNIHCITQQQPRV
ncbi:agmatine deiminase family protein [Roseospirillum parvum]|uniref:Agmatine deiminase n=1 Tax=Roseospirillum parvum TaxID=83401 RepID=A0A1G8CUC9_9PROT|nr:agmatine deiminase family protein [Roseospirillum parvum]SDH49101.1 agmatine deiminase [Roseospirillum parvum]